MATCDTPVANFQSEKSDMKVSEKYIQLMKDSLSDDSLYIRAKDTFKVIFEDLQLTEKEKAIIVSEHIASITTQLSGASMQTALAWAKEERDGAYTLAKTKADTENALAQFEKTKADICLTDKQTELQCANIEATIANSIRENGRVATYVNGSNCKPAALTSEGLKYEQTKQVEAASYQIHADTFRKSGVVQVGTDANDNIVKGLSGDDDGYTNQQSKNAERQRQAYEDSKVNHMLNAVGVVTGQLLSAEVNIADNPWLLDYMKSGMAKLLSPNSETSTPFGTAPVV